MQNNKPWARPVPKSEPRPYTELETRLIALLDQIRDDYLDFQVGDTRLPTRVLSEIQKDVSKELAKHPPAQSMVERVYSTLGCEDPS